MRKSRSAIVKTEDHSDRATIPVFIVGMNGSGTTMLLDHLGGHPNLYGFRLETDVLPAYIYKEQKYGDLQSDENFHKLWNDLRQEYAFVRVNKRQTLELPDNWREAERSVAGVFDAIMREFARRDGKVRWCEKTPTHVYSIKEISVSFPTAKFIHMIRDGRDCAASCLRRWGTHPVGAAVRWREAINQGRQAGEALPGRYHEVIYEEITSEPHRVLEDICRFLGEEFSDSLLTAKRTRPKMTGHSSAVMVPNSSSRALLADRKVDDKIERIAGKALSDCGYECKYPESEISVSWLDRLAWSFNDTRTFLAHLIKGKAGAQPHLTWSLFWQRIKTTAMTKLTKIKP